MQTNANNKIEKKNYSKGQIIILQGSNSKEIFYLNSGSIEIKRAVEDIQNFKGKDIIDRSKRIAIFDTPMIFGVNNLLNSNPHECSYVALTDCLVTKYIIESTNINDFFKSNLSLSFNILLSIQEDVRKKIINFKKFMDFFNLIEKINDNFMLLYLHVTQTKRDKLYQKFISNGGYFSEVIEPSFLTSDNSGILEKSYIDPELNPYNKFDKSKIDFFGSLLKAKPPACLSIISVDINIFTYIFESLTAVNASLNLELEKIVKQMDEKLEYFFNDKTSSFNLIYSIIDKLRSSGNVNPDIVKSIINICKNIDQINKQLGGEEYQDVYTKFDVVDKRPVSESIDKEEKRSMAGKYKKMFKDSTKKILSFSTLNNDAKNKLLKNLRAMQKINPEEILNKDVRVLIKNLQDDYFNLYMNLLLKVIKHPDNIPPYIRLFFIFSFIDEKIITEQQLEFIYNSLNIFTAQQNTDFTVITLFDFLLKIYNKEEEPSLSDKGEFRKLVTKYFGKSQKQIVDTQAGRLDFEIDNMVSMSMRVTSDNIRAFIPYLTEKSFKGTLSQLLVTPKKLDVYLKRVNAIDFTLFYRELTWKIPGKSELINKEIKPYLILLPSSGLRVQMWQEIVYNIRSTKARFMIPIIFNGDLVKALIHSCGHYRWNINKAVVSNWMDPVDGGITGAYYDYEQNYRKMMDLTTETKEKIKEQIRAIKIDRNRFAQDYYEWVIFESQGIPKLNKIVRKIFYRFIPFPNQIRTKISKLPVYLELDRKYEIIRQREFNKLEAKYKKYREVDQLPPDLQDYLDMMQR